MSAFKPSVADIVGLLGDIVSLASKAVARGNETSVKKILGKELQTTLVKTRADLEALTRFK